MSSYFFLFSLLASPPALAADLCTPRLQIEPTVNYCHENNNFVAPARACRDVYDAEVKAAKKKLEGTIATLLKKANTKAQNGNFKATEELLTTTRATLQEEISRGEEIFFEIHSYQEDFVLPIYKGYEEDFSIDPHSEAGQKIFREKECYGEPMDDLDAAKNDVKKMVKELQKTEAEIDQLYGATKEGDAGLGSRGSQAKVSKGQGGAVPKGKEKRQDSNVTGVLEDEKKNH